MKARLIYLAVIAVALFGGFAHHLKSWTDGH
jgi:hypothetical protein